MFLHIDMDYFYAQVEEQRHPMARGRIIVVCMFSGRTEDSGAVATVNYLGREAGIKAGMPIALARRRAPADSLFLPADREYYAMVSSQVDAIIRKMFARVVQLSIDEWIVEDAEAAMDAPRIKQEVKGALGLTCTVGVAPSPLGAKMAASKAKPDGLLVLDAGGERRLIDGSDPEKVPGIGPKTAEALRTLGIRKVGDLREADAVMLIETFGKKTGAWLHSLGMGGYPRELGQEKEQEEVSRIGTLKEMTRDPNDLLGRLDALEKDAREWLMEMRKSFRTISIIFVTEDMRLHTKSLSFRNPLPWNADIQEEKRRLIQDFLRENSLGVRRIGIRFGNFLDLGGQTTLF